MARFSGRGGADRRWERELRRQLEQLPTADPASGAHDADPVAPVRGPVRRPSRRQRARARRARATPASSSVSVVRGERRRTVITLAVTVVLVLAVGAASLGPSAPYLRRLVGLGPTAAGGNGHDFAFIHTTRSGRPGAFSPCHPVHIVVNPDQAPADWQSLVDDGIRTVSAATGLSIIDDGTTSDDDYFDRRTLLTDSPEPVLIGWSTSDRVHDLDGDVAGVTSSDYNPSTGHYDTGRVVLDADAYRELADQPGGHLEERAILLHELGHLVGLAHVDDPGELMYPTVGTRSTYGPGDLEGLRRIGQVPC